MARPAKTEEERYLRRDIRWPPDLWDRLRQTVPDRQRSAVIHRGLSRELDRLERLARRRGVAVEALVQEMAREEQLQRQIDRLKAAKDAGE